MDLAHVLERLVVPEGDCDHDICARLTMQEAPLDCVP